MQPCARLTAGMRASAEHCSDRILDTGDNTCANRDLATPNNGRKSIDPGGEKSVARVSPEQGVRNRRVE